MHCIFLKLILFLTHLTRLTKSPAWLCPWRVPSWPVAWWRNANPLSHIDNSTSRIDLTTTLQQWSLQPAFGEVRSTCNCTEVHKSHGVHGVCRFDADEPRMQLGIHLHQGLNIRPGRAALAEAAPVCPSVGLSDKTSEPNCWTSPEARLGPRISYCWKSIKIHWMSWLSDCRTQILGLTTTGLNRRLQKIVTYTTLSSCHLNAQLLELSHACFMVKH